MSSFCRSCGLPINENDRFCRQCGTSTEVAHPRSEARIDLGLVKSVTGRVEFELVIKPNGVGHVLMTVFDTMNGRRQPIHIYLDDRGYAQLLNTVEKTTETLSEVQAAGKLTRFGVG